MKTKAVAAVLSIISLSQASALGQTLTKETCAVNHIDSTCASKISAVTTPVAFPGAEKHIISSTALAGVPDRGLAYWGFDRDSFERGISSSLPFDMFINHSTDQIEIELIFNIPIGIDCGRGCLPGIEFKVNPSWNSIFPTIVKDGDSASAKIIIEPRQSYGFVVGLWQATNPRLIVRAIHSTSLRLKDVGIPDYPDIASPIEGPTEFCTCADGTTAICSYGTRYSNGLMGVWRDGGYYVSGRGSTCTAPS